MDRINTDYVRGIDFDDPDLKPILKQARHVLDSYTHERGSIKTKWTALAETSRNVRLSNEQSANARASSEALLRRLNEKKSHVAQLRENLSTSHARAKSRTDFSHSTPTSLEDPSFPDWSRLRLLKQCAEYLLWQDPPLLETANALIKEEPKLAHLVDMDTWSVLHSLCTGDNWELRWTQWALKHRAFLAETRLLHAIKILASQLSIHTFDELLSDISGEPLDAIQQDTSSDEAQIFLELPVAARMRQLAAIHAAIQNDPLLQKSQWESEMESMYIHERSQDHSILYERLRDYARAAFLVQRNKLSVPSIVEATEAGLCLLKSDSCMDVLLVSKTQREHLMAVARRITDGSKPWCTECPICCAPTFHDWIEHVPKPQMDKSRLVCRTTRSPVHIDTAFQSHLAHDSQDNWVALPDPSGYYQAFCRNNLVFLNDSVIHPITKVEVPLKNLRKVYVM